MKRDLLKRFPKHAANVQYNISPSRWSGLHTHGARPTLGDHKTITAK